MLYSSVTDLTNMKQTIFSCTRKRNKSPITFYSFDLSPEYLAHFQNTLFSVVSPSSSSIISPSVSPSSVISSVISSIVSSVVSSLSSSFSSCCFF
mmetsp:Transcript_35804/g.55945  ORF Transcript_35804/g.55945 Transcript_35804/m.55945 type:complete len:95 (-) Transcript_35804:245-529(-)